MASGVCSSGLVVGVAVEVSVSGESKGRGSQGRRGRSWYEGVKEVTRQVQRSGILRIKRWRGGSMEEDMKM